MSAIVAETTPGLLGQDYRAITLGMVTVVSLIAFESLAVATIMPDIAESLGGMSVYALAFGIVFAASGVGMIWAGSWADQRGPAAPLAYGIGAFALGLLLAGLAPDMTAFLLGRVVQGLGSGLVSVALYVVIGHVYPLALRPRVFAAVSASWVIPSLVGPAISALILQHAGWRWVFLGVPLLALPATWLLRPAFRITVNTPTPPRQNTRTRLSWAIGATLCVCLLPGSTAPMTGMSSVLTGAALIGLFLFASKLLPYGTFGVRAGVPAVIALRALAAAAYFGTEVFVPLMLAQERVLAPLWVGVILTIGAIGYSAGSWFQGAASTSPTGASRLRLGMTLIGCGVAAVALSLPTVTPLGIGIAGWFAAGFGMGMVYPILAARVLELSDPQQRGGNSAALQLANALAIAAMLAVGSVLYATVARHSRPLAFAAVYACCMLFAAIGGVLAHRAFAAPVQAH